MIDCSRGNQMKRAGWQIRAQDRLNARMGIKEVARDKESLLVHEASIGICRGFH